MGSKKGEWGVKSIFLVLAALMIAAPVLIYAAQFSPLSFLTGFLMPSAGPGADTTLALNQTFDDSTGPWKVLSYAAQFLPDSFLTGFFVLSADSDTDPSLVLNLTFDDSADPWKDYSQLNHQFFNQSGATYANKTYCKWYGCANLTLNGNDILNASSLWAGEDGFSISFWVYHKVGAAIGGGTSQGYFAMYNRSQPSQGYSNVDGRIVQVGCCGMSAVYNAINGSVAHNDGASNIPADEQWYHYFISYNPTDARLLIWKNGVNTSNSSEPYGALNYSVGDEIWIGKMDGVDAQAYIDEFLAWNRSNFNTADVQAIYNAQIQGTPPVIDLYVKAIEYALPVDWSSPTNTLVPGTMNVNFTIANAGTGSSGSFNYAFYLDGAVVCSGRPSLNAQSEINVSCPWSASNGFHKGNITVDLSSEVSEDIESNNAQAVYIPFLDRPFFHFNLSEWNNDIVPYASNSSNALAYSSWSWTKAFSCSAFSDSYTGNSVDPYGKKARECAMSCLENNYTEPGAPSKTQCSNAKRHLMGWANRTLSSYSNVQSIHELVHVGMAYDIMFPNLTKAENDYLVPLFHNICQQITNLPNTRPDLDDDSEISGGNGFGFGSGMGGFCYSILGSYPENPTLIQQPEQQYWGSNIPDEWMDRELSFLRDYKNDSWAKYQERWHYKFYSQFHLVENWLFEKRFALSDVSEYQNAFCAMAREMLTDTLDFNYNGNTLRNDENRKLRAVQAGDSNSYDDPGSDSFLGYSIITYYGILCDDVSTKQNILWFRNYIYSQGEGTINYPDTYLYQKLAGRAGSAAAPEGSMPKVIFDNANDILTIRTNYTYANDTVIEIDGGEEKGGGHSQAQGYYLYALGEPFLDYEQVPYNDDTRMDVWKNGISLQDTSQASEGTGGVWNSACGDRGYNQYYGMKDCPTPKYPADYPNSRNFPLQYGGDVEGYVGTADGSFAGAYVWRPYYNADPVNEYFVKFGDLLAKRTIVSNNLEGSIYHNFINVNDEFNETRNGTTLAFTRGNKNLVIEPVYTSQALTLGGGDSGLRYCFSKTSCSGSFQGAGNYRRTYYYTPSSNLDFILAHYWHLDGQQQAVSPVGTAQQDRGLSQGSNFIIFDTSGDGTVKRQSRTATGWAMAYNDDTSEIAAFNTTNITIGGLELFQANDTLSVHIIRSVGSIVLSANTMERNGFIDYPKTVRVRINVSEMSAVSDYTITKSNGDVVPIVDETADNLAFDVQSGQNSEFYTISAPVLCNIQSAKWGAGKAIEGESVGITLNTKGCDGSRVNLTFYEADNASDPGPANDTIDAVSLGLPLSLPIVNGGASYAWTAQWVEDTDGADTDPEYAFTAYGLTNVTSSGELKVARFSYKSVNISLTLGWNLVSMRVQPVNASIDAVFKDISGKLETIYAFNPTDGWLIHHFNPLFPSVKFNITAGAAYNIKAKENVTLLINGTESTLPQILEVGWNLIGLKQTSEVSFKDFFALYADSIKEGWELSNGTYQLINITGNDTMKANRGYWLLINQTINISS